MGFSLQLDFLRAILFRIHKLSKRRRSGGNPGCVGRIRTLTVPALSSLKGIGSWMEKPINSDKMDLNTHYRECRNIEDDSNSGRRKQKKKLKREEEAGNGEVVVRPEGVQSREEAYCGFTKTNPGYLETLVLDEIRAEEYEELEEEGHVCLDYSGYGLFSPLQHDLDRASSSFALSYISGCLASYARYGDPDPGTIEDDVRRRIMRFLNLHDQEYSMVFTSSRGSAFKLLAESFPFHSSSRFLSMYDYYSHAVSWMEQIALKYGAHVSSASFKWPSLSVCASDLKAKIVHKKRRSTDGSKGLFVFPAQSRVTGSKYSYQWMSLAQENDWHVLLDASALGPKDMDSLGLSLFRPDFIVTSFYKVFGSDPTGFGCLFIKNSAINSLQQSSAARGVGMVRLVPSPGVFSPSSASETSGDCERHLVEIQEARDNHTPRGRSRRPKTNVVEEPAFSAPIASLSKTEHSCLDQHGVDENQDICSRNDNSQSSDIVRNAGSRLAPCNDNSVSDLTCIREHSTNRKNRYITKYLQPKHDIETSGIGRKEDGVLKINMCRDAKNEATHSLLASGEALYLSCSQREPQCGMSSEERKNTSGGKTLPMFPTSGERSLSTEHQSQNHDDDIGMKFQVVDKSMKFQVVDKSSESQKGKEQVDCFEPGEAAGKQTKPGLTAASLQRINVAAQRRSRRAYHSHEIRRDVGCSAGSGVLVLRDSGRDCCQVHSEGSSYCGGSQEDLEFSSSLYQEDEDSSEFDMADDASVVRREPEIFCRGLNHADTLDLKKTNERLGILMSWLISSLLKLQHLKSNKFSRLVQIYGPRLNSDRGASLAFNLFDRDGIMIRPSLVQQLADRNNISLGTGMLYHIQFPANWSHLQGLVEPEQDSTSTACSEYDNELPKLAVVTIALGLVSNFDDVYRLWTFVAMFLDEKFVSKELYCYQSLNQEQIVVAKSEGVIFNARQSLLWREGSALTRTVKMIEPAHQSMKILNDLVGEYLRRAHKL